MSILYDRITAGNIAGFYEAKQQNVDTTLGEKIFPAKKQLGLKLSFVKGSSGNAVVLKPAAFDTKVTLRERMSVEISDEEMPFFKEAMLVKEADRQQLNMISQSGNQGYIDTIINGIFDDNTTLISGARARLEAMRMQVLATGRIAINANGVPKDFDYGVKDDHKSKVKVAWTDAKANPLGDIRDAVKSMGEIGLKPEVLYMNPTTFYLLADAKSTALAIKPLAPDGSSVTEDDLKAYLMKAHGIQIVLKDETYVGDDGNRHKFYPDGYVTFAPNSSLGNTVFGTTPEESDLMGGANVGAEVSVVETGIAVTTTKTTDPVNVQTKVSMIALPSFERLDDVYMLEVGA